MTTADSPIAALKAQADKIAAALKNCQDLVHPNAMTKFGIVMDDKLITVEMSWMTIRTLTQIEISDFILGHMTKKLKQGG